jgi:hypothetical protein
MLTDGRRTKSDGNSSHGLKTTPCHVAAVKSSVWFIIKQQWTIEEISIFSNSIHLEWRAGLSDTILKETHSGTIPARLGLIWFSGFRGEDLNVIFYQNMSNLHNRYKSTERKISQKNAEYMLNYSLPCSCS